MNTRSSFCPNLLLGLHSRGAKRHKLTMSTRSVGPIATSLSRRQGRRQHHHASCRAAEHAVGILVLKSHA